MVRRSNEIRRETCRVQEVDGSVVNNGSTGRSELNGPGPPATRCGWRGANKTTSAHPVEASGRSQSPHSSDEAMQHNVVEPRGTGR